jgi:hypothetical protein
MLVSIIAPTAAQSRTHRVRFIAAADSVMVCPFALEKKFPPRNCGRGWNIPVLQGSVIMPYPGCNEG